MSDPATKPAPGDARDELRAKIEARERRIAERTLADEAREVAGAATEYVKQHPLQVVGGAIALGLLIGLLTKPGRRAVGNAASGTASAVGGAASGAAKGVGAAAKKRGSAIGNLLADALVAYGIKLIDDALESARTGQDASGDGNTTSASDPASKRDAEQAADAAAENTRAMGNRTRRQATRAVRNLANRIPG